MSATQAKFPTTLAELVEAIPTIETLKIFKAGPGKTLKAYAGDGTLIFKIRSADLRTALGQPFVDDLSHRTVERDTAWEPIDTTE